MNKRKLILRDYQIPASEFAMQKNMSVLALAPGAGKTEISIDVIERFLKQNPKGKVLVLAHSTTILKDNYFDRLEELEVNFTYSKIFDKNAQVHICLPQSQHLIKNNYDLLIVDEAHENYLEKRIQSIIKKTKPSKQLLLTGTPAKFIKEGGYDIYTLALNAIPQEYFAKLNIELVASNYNWAKELNSECEVNKGYVFNKKDTELTLESILLKLIERVKKCLTPEEFNNPSLLTKLKSWAYTYKKLGRTIIICRSIKQGHDVYNILIKNNVSSTISESKSDKNSDEITKFSNNEYDVLVVVDRARLGYSDNGLYNIIDMSGSHNPNIINQIFSRVVRGTPDVEKYYLKVTTQEYGMMDYTHACVCGALMLTDNRYLSTFNGANFNGIIIPVIKKTKTNLGGGNGGNSTIKKIKKFIFPEFTNDVIDMFRNIIHDLDNPVSIYKTTTIKEVRDVLSNRANFNEAEIFASATGLERNSEEWVNFVNSYAE